MKHFSWIRAISLLLVLVMCLGMVACGNTGDGGDGNEDPEDSNNNKNNNETTDQDLFAELKAAYEAFVAHDGAMSIAAMQKQVATYAEETQEVTAFAQYAIDKENTRYFVKNSYAYGEDISENTQKGFVSDGAFYVYEISASGEESQESYTKYADAKSLLASADGEDVEETLTQIAGGTFLAESYDELTNAFETTYPQLLANELTYMKNEGELKDDATMTLTPTVTIEQEKDGTIVLTIVSAITVSEMGSESDQLKNANSSMIRTFSAKDGKLTASTILMKVSYETPAEEGDGMDKVEQQLEMAFVLSDTFDEEGYNAISVSLPSDPAEIQEARPNRTLSVVVGGTSNTYYIDAADTTELYLNRLSGSVESHYTMGFPQGSTTPVTPLTVKGFYKDAALTQKVENSMSLEDLLALKTVYADVEIIDGYALVLFSHDEEIQISRAYQIVATPLFYGKEMGMNESHLRPITEPIALSYQTARGEDYKILVNGVETTADTLTPENGKTYLITYVTVTQDKDLGVSYVVNFGF